jgi:hypothetical protein
MGVAFFAKGRDDKQHQFRHRTDTDLVLIDEDLVYNFGSCLNSRTRVNTLCEGYSLVNFPMLAQLHAAHLGFPALAPVTAHRYPPFRATFIYLL